MLIPGIFGEDLFDSWMDSFENDFWGKKQPAYTKQAPAAMRTDVRETENSYELDVDLPGYRKEDIKVQLKDGNLTIYASKNTEKEEKDKNGKYVRRERYTGNMSRSFHVGNTITETDIHAKFEDGILKLSLPKPSQKAVEHKGYIAIEG